MDILKKIKTNIKTFQNYFINFTVVKDTYHLNNINFSLKF